MSQPNPIAEIKEAEANGMVYDEETEKWVKGVPCDYCDELSVPGDEHTETGGDESMTMCESCYQHMCE